jgi:hypothetical protein
MFNFYGIMFQIDILFIFILIQFNKIELKEIINSKFFGKNIEPYHTILISNYLNYYLLNHSKIIQYFMVD